MELAIISPPAMLELSGLVDRYHMVLPSFIDYADETYTNFYKDLSGYKILDNGTAEGKLHSALRLHDMAEQVGADCIIVHDKLGQTDLTIKLCRAFAKHHNPALDYMGVLQGKTLSEVLKCLYFYDNECPWITMLGIPRILCYLHKTQRVTLTESIIDQQQKGNIRPFKLHALGASEWVNEIHLLREAGVHGMDTSLPVVYGLEAVGLDHDYIARKSDFIGADVDRSSIEWRYCFDNTVQLLRWAGQELR